MKAEKDQQTDQYMLHFTVRTFVSIVGGLLLGTNLLNSVLHDIAAQEREDVRLSEKIDYNVAAEKRRRAHDAEVMEYKLEINNLKRDLKNCENEQK